MTSQSETGPVGGCGCGSTPVSLSDLPTDAQAAIAETGCDFLKAESPDGGRTVNVFVRTRGAELPTALVRDSEYNGYSCVESIIEDCRRATRELWQRWPGHYASDRTRCADWLARASILAMSHRLRHSEDGRACIFLAKTMYRCGHEWSYPRHGITGLAAWLCAGLWSTQEGSTEPHEVVRQETEMTESFRDARCSIPVFSTPRGLVAVACKGADELYAKCKVATGLVADGNTDLDICWREAEETVRIDGTAPFITPKDSSFEVNCPLPDFLLAKTRGPGAMLCFPL